MSSNPSCQFVLPNSTLISPTLSTVTILLLTGNIVLKFMQFFLQSTNFNVDVDSSKRQVLFFEYFCIFYYKMS